MSDTELLKAKYLGLKQKLGRKPKFKEFLSEGGINRRMLVEAYGRNAYSKLQNECGDSPNKLTLSRTSKDVIFTQYGNLTRELGELPRSADWTQRNCNPSESGLARPPHNIKWSKMPQKFLDHYGRNPAWKDVVKIIEANLSQEDSTKPEARSKEFDAVINKIQDWTPKRRRNSEEGYKIELREYFENDKKYSVLEETGESNVDLVVNAKFAIELKKKPTLAEYDRLFGQIARHFNTFHYVIALICDVSSDDQYRRFVRNISEIYEKLNLNIWVLTK